MKNVIKKYGMVCAMAVVVNLSAMKSVDVAHGGVQQKPTSEQDQVKVSGKVRKAKTVRWADRKTPYDATHKNKKKKARGQSAPNQPSVFSKKNEQGDTVLHMAVEREDVPMITLLLESKAHVDERDRHGATPLYQAAANSRDMQNALGVMEILLRNGADVNAALRSPSCHASLTPLHAAVSLGTKDAVQLLVKHKADIEAQDGNGKTPIDYAKRDGDQEIVDLLEAELAIGASGVRV